MIGWQDEDETLLREESGVFNDNNTLAWFKPIEEKEVLEPMKDEKDDNTSCFEEKEDKENTHLPVRTRVIELDKQVKDYENWEGRIVSTEEDSVIARLVNTQRIYSPRMMQINKTVFSSKGISKKLSVGDMFELTYKNIQFEYHNPKKGLTYREANIDTIVLVEQKRLSRKEIEEIASRELESLSYLFE